MATEWFASPYGLDTNNGLGPDPTDSTNKPWLTPGKAFQAGTAFVAGDRLRCGPGLLYQGGSITPAAGLSTSASHGKWEGDPTNLAGFRDGSGALVPPGICGISTRTSAEGEDSGNWASTAHLLLGSSQTAMNGFEIRKLILEARPDGSYPIQLSWIGNADWTIEDCIGLGFGLVNYPTAVCTAARNLTVQRNELYVCHMFNFQSSSAAATADADLVILAEANLVYGRLTAGGQQLGASGGNIAGGVRFHFNTVEIAGPNGVYAITTTALRVSTVTPMRVKGNDFYGGSVGNIGTAGHLVSDGGNRSYNTGASILFTADATDFNWPFPRRSFASLEKWGIGLPRSDHLAWLNDAASTIRATALASTNPDFRNRTIRKAAGATVGAFEAWNVAQDTGSVITGGGVNSWKVTGNGENHRLLHVYLKGGVTTTITVVTSSSGYGGASYPQMVLGANPATGLTEQTATATDATEQTLTVTATPTADCVVTLRFLSRSSNGTSLTRFDVLRKVAA